MPVRIRVRNFQSIVDAEIVVDGFTVVTGPNNSGKTAVIRAVQGAFANSSGDAAVRHGTDKTVVEVTFDDKQTVKWEKGPKVKPTYAVGGKILHPGRAVPDEVSALGIRPIQVGQMAIWPQIAAQFTGQVFLLDLPGSSIAEAVADVDRVGRLTQALRFAETDKRSANSDLRLRRQDVEQGKKDVARFTGVDTLLTDIQHAEALLQEAHTIMVEHALLQALWERAQDARADISRYVGVRDVVVPTSLRFEETRKVQRTLSLVYDLQSRLRKARQVVGVSTGIREVRVPSPPTEGVRLRDELRVATQLKSRRVSAEAAVSAATKAVTAVRELALSEPSEVVAKASKTRTTLGIVAGFRDRLVSCKREVSNLQTNLGLKVQHLSEAEAEVSALLSEMGACPVCQSVISSSSHTHEAP